MDIGDLIFISLTFVLAGFVKGVIGLGLPTVGMGLLAVAMTRRAGERSERPARQLYGARAGHSP